MKKIKQIKKTKIIELYDKRVRNQMKKGEVQSYKDSQKRGVYSIANINNEQIRRLYNIEKKINYKESPFYLAYNERNNNGSFKRRGEDISSYEKIRQNKDYFGNKKNSLDKNEYRDMKNFNSHNFHKKHLSSSDN